MYAANKTNAPNPADPIAYPLVTAFVVFPTASKASVVFLTLFGSLAISAIPPALSVTGPYASNATTIPVKANIEVTATAMPNKPAKLLVNKIPATIISAGIAVASMDTAKPCITFVPCPVVDD